MQQWFQTLPEHQTQNASHTGIIQWVSLSLEHQELSSDRKVQTCTVKGPRAWSQIKKLPKGIIFQSMLLLPIEELCFSYQLILTAFYSTLQDRNQIKWILSRNILPHHQEQSLALLPGILICGWDYVTLGYWESIQPYSRASGGNTSVWNIHQFKKVNCLRSCNTVTAAENLRPKTIWGGRKSQSCVFFFLQTSESYILRNNSKVEKRISVTLQKLKGIIRRLQELSPL